MLKQLILNMKTLITFILTINCLYTSAQLATLSIGTDATNASGSVAISIGEAIIGFAQNTQNSLSIGVQQPNATAAPNNDFVCNNTTYGQRVSGITESSATLVWSPVPNATLYRVRGTGLSETTINSGNQFFWQNLQPNTSYNWDLRARVSDASGTYFTSWVSCSFQTVGSVQKLEINKNDWQINVYPNPFTHQFNLAINNALEGTHEVVIFDIAGKIVKRMQQHSSNENINIGAALKAGHYQIVVINPNQERRFVRLVKYE